MSEQSNNIDNDQIDELGELENTGSGRKKRVFFLLLGFLIVVAVVLAGGGYWYYTSETVEPQTSLLRVRFGDVKIQTSEMNSWQPASGVVELSAGDWVWLGERAKATLWCFDGSSALLSGPAQIGIDCTEKVAKRYGGEKSVVELQLVSGKMLTEVASMATDSSVFAIRTPFGAIRSGSAIFEVDIEQSTITEFFAGDTPVMATVLAPGDDGRLAAALIEIDSGQSICFPVISQDDDGFEAVLKDVRSSARRLLNRAFERESLDVRLSGLSLVEMNTSQGWAIYKVDAASGSPTVAAPKPDTLPFPGRATIVDRQVLDAYEIAVAEFPILAVPSVPELPISETDIAGPQRPKKPTYLFSVYGIEKPLGVAADPEGRFFYVTESGANRALHVFDREGIEVTNLIPPGSSAQVTSRAPVYVAVDRTTGTIYVTDRMRACIDMYDYTGDYLGKFSPPGEDTVWAPMALVFDELTENWGELYLTDFTSGKHAVMVFDINGELKLTFGEKGEGPNEFSFPNGIAIDSLGNIYVSDSNNFRVQIYNYDGGELISGAGSVSVGLPRGIAINDRDMLNVVDTFGHSIAVFQAGASFTSLFSFGEPGIGFGQFNYPNGIAFDKTGRIYITDRENDRVQVWEY